MFAEATIKKSRYILNLLKEVPTNMESYADMIRRNIEIFVNERKRELKLLEKTIAENKTLRQRLGKNQVENGVKNFMKKLKDIEDFFNSLPNEVEKVKRLMEELKQKSRFCVIGNYDFRKPKDKERYLNDVNEEKRLLQKRIEEKENFFKKVKKAITRILEAIEEKMIYFMETQYVVTKRIIFKAHYKNEKFWYFTKI